MLPFSRPKFSNPSTVIFFISQLFLSLFQTSMRQNISNHIRELLFLTTFASGGHLINLFVNFLAPKCQLYKSIERFSMQKD